MQSFHYSLDYIDIKFFFFNNEYNETTKSPRLDDGDSHDKHDNDSM